MNLFRLVFKQMRQRALSTWLTFLSVALGVALAIAILVLYREGDKLFAQSDYGFDVLVGPKASPLQLTLNTIYHVDRSPGNIPYSIYEDLNQGGKYASMVRTAIPFAVGDSYRGLRIIGTSTKMFGYTEEGRRIGADAFEYRPGKRYEMGQGKLFEPNRFHAVIGAEAARITGLKIGDRFQATHGVPRPEETPDVHEEQWTVVGILDETHTANDRVLFIPLTTFYCIFEHEEGLEAQAMIKKGEDIAKVTAAAQKHDHDARAYTTNPDGTIHLTLPKDQLQLSAVLVKARNSFSVQQLLYLFNNRSEACAVNPANTMREFFRTFLKGSRLLLLTISALVTVVAAIGILVSIYNSVSARLKEIAIIRALGATRLRVLSLICMEAGIVGLIGGVSGLIVGHGMVAVGNIVFRQVMGESINFIYVGLEELIYIGVVVVIAVLAGLVPALKAYSTPVATNLVG